MFNLISFYPPLQVSLMRSHQRLNVELDQKGAALYAGCTEHVGEAFQGVDARALDAHAVGEADPVELGPRQILLQRHLS